MGGGGGWGREVAGVGGGVGGRGGGGGEGGRGVGGERIEAGRGGDGTVARGGAVGAWGGGAVLSPENRAGLRSKGISVWLEAKPETLAMRISTEDARPLLVGATGEARIERLRELEAERGAAYAQADLRIPTEIGRAHV